MFNSLFVEKYRPATLDDIILTEENYKAFNQFREQEKFQIYFLLERLELVKLL